MSKIMSRSCLLVAAFLCVGAFAFQASAASESSETLKSGYSGKVLADGARRITLEVKWDEKGHGSGSLTLDPNITNGMFSTCMAFQSYSVQLQLISDDDYSTKGRRLYALKEMGPEGNVGKDVRWYLMRPTKIGEPSWLIFVDKNGKTQDVVVVE
jgi:hypothetical protein